MTYSIATSLRQAASRSALLLALGLGLGSCEKILDQPLQNQVDASTGFRTRQDAIAGLRGCYDALQSNNYYGLRYETFADLIAGNIRHTGTFPTFAQIAQNQILSDNTDVRNVWNIIYDAINRDNYFIQNVATINDPSYNAASAIAEARTLRALNYMNLLGFWGGSSLGYGYSDGVGVPLRLTPTLTVSDAQPMPRATEAAVVAAIRSDLTFALDNLSSTTTANTGVTRNAILALRARLELRMRNYAEALNFARQVTGNINTNTDNIFQLSFLVVDANQLAFFWFPSAAGGRNELDPSDDLAAAHPAGDLRLPINVVTASNTAPGFPVGTTRKYSRIATNDDPVNIVRYSEMVLTMAEAYAQTNDLVNAAAQLNLIRAKAGLAGTTATTQAALITDILLQRRLELAHEGHYWFDLRRTNTVQAALPGSTQTFRNLWPIPFQEILNSGNVLVQNSGY